MQTNTWRVTENSFDAAAVAHNESIFSLGNGSLGFRGDFEEGTSATGSVEGVYLNGFYETAPIRYGEVAYGYAQNSQTMLNLANPKRVRLALDGELLDLATGTLESYCRSLDMEQGVLERAFVWRSPAGRRVRVETSRFVSLAGENLAFIHYSITPLEGIDTLEITSVIDYDVKNLADGSDPRVGSGLGANPLETVAREVEQGGCLLVQRTRSTALAYTCAVRHGLAAANDCARQAVEEEFAVGESFTCKAQSGEAVTLTKVVAFAHGGAAGCEGLAVQAATLAEKGLRQGMAAALAAHKRVLAGFWEAAGLTIEGDDTLLRGLRFNLFHLFCAAGRDGKTNIPAKGLTGEGYEGHYFWDTETYVLPFLVHTMPQLARSLLVYRHSILPAARRRARELAHERGALYAWRTIGGEECSAYYPAGTAQYHINADIANAVGCYVDATGDEDFMRDYGLEMLVETARLWRGLGFYNPAKGGAFSIYGVTGPDEYNVLVNDNCYTNLMARHNLRLAAWWVRQATQLWPEAAEGLFQRLEFGAEEAEAWERAADTMVVPYNEALGIYEQDDAFTGRQPWPLGEIPQENFPLLLHYHPLVIYRHKVCKQADLVLALFLRGEVFTTEQKKACFDYYEPLTTHDSSLSKAVFGIMASEVGYPEKAYRYFESSALLDLQDGHGNTKDGLHMANMAGTWMGIVYGFAGMRTQDGLLGFAPTLPGAWEGYGFQICYRGRTLRVEVTRHSATYTLCGGEALTLLHHGGTVALEPGQTKTLPARHVA